MRIFAQKQNQPQQKSSADLTRSNAASTAAAGRQLHPLLHLQRTIGNQGVLRLLRARSDRLNSSPEDGFQTPAASSDAGQIGAPSIVNEVLASPGRPLDPETRAFMEPRFGHDFSKVRVHSGSPVDAQSAQEVNANAYTVGHHIVFGTGRYAPKTHQGRRLIAHELAHVVQQSGDVAGPATILARNPDDPNEELALTLAKKWDKKRDEVLDTLSGLEKKDLDALDKAASKIKSKNKSELLRAIRFVRDKPPARSTQTLVTVEGSGTSTAKTKIAGGKVELHTGVSFKFGGDKSTNAYSLTYDGPGVDEMRWLQFVWREVVPEFPATSRRGKPRKVPHKKRLDRPSGRPEHSYFLTTDPKKPKWNTDSSSGSSAFYEENTSVNRSGSKLVMFDAPDTMASDAKILLQNATNPATRVVSHFHATTYLIRGMDVLYRADIDLLWTFTDPTKEPTLKVTAKGGKATQIESSQRARLVAQYPNVDYLPGPPIAAPEPMEQFEPVSDLFPTGTIQEKDWASKNDMQKYADIAAIAHAEWIRDVTGMSESTINIIDSSNKVKPGLNYDAKLTVEAETGFINAQSELKPDLPIEAAGPLPRIGIILGPQAFERDKAFALATLRHEMKHAAHNELALGWLLKWRDARTGESFKDWLAKEQKSKHISEVEFALVSTGVTLNLAATETLAWTEGFVTVVPFLPEKPAFALMTPNYPAAIAELKGAGKFYNAVASTAVKKAALERIRGFSCGVLSQSQRDRVIEWIPFLLDPNSLNPSTTAEKTTVTLINNDFTPLKDFLKEVLAEVKKACRK
jgi:hypothetical protein